jgi:hypothetical protein
MELNQVAHFIPQSLLNEKRDPDKRKKPNWPFEDIFNDCVLGCQIIFSKPLMFAKMLLCSIIMPIVSLGFLIGLSRWRLELMERIFKMRGHADYYEIDSDDEYDPVQCMEKLIKYKQDDQRL